MPMFNPQQMMNGMGMNGQLPKSPTVSELWKNEKSKYRHWMIIFGIGMVVIFALMIASVVLNATSEATIKQQMASAIWSRYAPAGSIVPSPWTSATGAELSTLTSDGASYWANIGRSFTITYIAMPAVQIAFVGIGLILFVSTITQSYQHKSFAKLSPWSTIVMGLGTFIAVYQLFSLIWDHGQGLFNTPGGIFQFITYFLLIAVWFGGASQVSRIRKQFAFAARIEQIKKSPEYQQAMAQMQAMQNGQGFTNGPFGPTMGTAQGAATGTPGAAPQQPTEPAKSDERKSLESMSVTDLKSVAKKLSISGYTAMKKPELIEAILRVTESN